METKVLTKIVLLDREDNICMCDKKFFKSCPVRVLNNLPCVECAISISPMVENNPVDRDQQTIFTAPVMFQDTLDYFGKLR